GGLLAACSSGLKGAGKTTGGTINIGFITPLTGPLSGFASGDQYVLQTITESQTYKKGIKICSTTYKANRRVRASPSDPPTAGQAAQQVITQNRVDMMLTTSTPETTNPVAAAAQHLQTPCLYAVVPWEAWYGGLGGDPLKPTQSFQYCTM